MIGIHTHSTKFYHLEFWRYVISVYVLHKQRGPDAVRDSLILGLKELDIKFVLDPKQPREVTVVLSGIEALRQSVTAKHSGQIKKLVAGPNIVMHPYHAKRIICNEAIDAVLVPSKWVADFWAQEAPELRSKLVVWPAGVTTAVASTRNGPPIIYDKLGNSALLAEIKKVTSSETIVFTYGSFSKQQYLQALAKAPYLIYLAKSESQGLALQEAWAHDVPTIVNESHYWRNGELSWESDQINAPYLTTETGLIFKKVADLPVLIQKSVTLYPKIYCDRELSNAVTTSKLLSLLWTRL